MNKTVHLLRGKKLLFDALIFFSFLICSQHVGAQTAPQPVVAIHVSELTQALETMVASPPTPTGTGTTGYQWFYTSWHYFVAYESLKEALRSDGTPYVAVSDADIAAGNLLNPDGSPRYPILISLASEAIDNNEIAPLRDYVTAGGFLFVGSSAFTRNPDGTTRGDFALATEMGLNIANPIFQNWYTNLHFTKVVDNRLVANIPAGTISWRMPLSSDEIPLGVSPGHGIHGSHYVFQVTAAGGATVIANGDTGPLLATRQYGKGNFIYHGALQPLIGHTIYDPAMYAYLIYRGAIEWAFEAFNLPIIKLSPWRYDYNAAFVVRHDFEDYAASIRAIESSASFESSIGAKGDYYFCTGTLREEMPDITTVVASLRRAVTNYGATIGSHNGGLRNPDNSGLALSDFDYWHWGPDEALDVTPPGYASGQAYAQASLSAAFQDVEGWLAGVDNGRPGCGLAGNCPRIWAAPYMNSTREPSRIILETLNVKSLGTGEQKIGPFPHWALSYETPGRFFSYISEPTSDWYVGTEIPGALEWGHTTDSMMAAVDFYYNLGAPINLYGHIVSDATTLMGQYVQYGVSKPRMWITNAVGIADWWQLRSTAVVTPSYSVIGNTAISQATITGATDPNTTIEVAIPNGNINNILQVLINGSPADPTAYRTVGNVVKIKVGSSTSSATVQYTIDNPVPALTSLSPTAANAGGADFTLTVNGTGFVTSSVVQWNGLDRTTTYVSSTQLTAAISASDIASTGTASVTVFNPAPAGGVSNIQTFTINNPQAVTWTQTDWLGGGGQSIWLDVTRYSSAGSIDNSVSGQISLASASTSLFSDDFSRPTGTTDPLLPWVASMGTWTVTEGVLQGTGNPGQYSYAYYTTTPQWTDYIVQGNIQIPAGSFGGGIGGRLDPATGAHYGAWVYPAGSTGGSNVLKLWKFRGWTDLGGGIAMQQVSLPDVGIGWHTLQMTFIGSRIQVYYDGSLKIDVIDNNYDSQAAYVSGGISADWYMEGSSPTISVDNISVTTLPAYGSSGVLVSSAFDGGAGVQWQTVSWDATAGGSTSVCVRTRTADTSDLLAAASWSACYGSSGSGSLSANNRWIQYEVEMGTSDPSTSPVFNEIRISYLPSTPVGPIPVINNMSPSTAVTGGVAFTLTVNGTNFATNSVVQWNGSNRSTTYVSPTQLTTTVLSSDIATAGTASVTVFNSAPGGSTSNAQSFTINNPVPTTASLSPASATAGGAGFTLTVNGTGFVSGSTVQWNGSNRTTTYVSSTQLTAVISAADITSAGPVQVTVFNPFSNGSISNAQTFTINNPAPAITGLSPTSTNAGEADFTLTVNGTGFITGSVVQWNGLDRTTTYVSSTQLTAAISASDIASTGTVSVTVFNPSPGGGITSARAFLISISSGTWTQTDWLGGGGQSIWLDVTRYSSAGSIDNSVSGQISLASARTLLFSDDFTRPTGTTDPLLPWVASMGTWTVTGGVLQGTGSANQYSYAYYSTTPQWTDYIVQGNIQIPAGSFGGGIGGRLDPATGAHYGAWVYPAGSTGGSNVLQLWKFRGWTDLGGGIAMQQVSLPDVGIGWHTLQMTFIGNRIQVYYDGVLKIDVTDNNYDSQAAYLSGGISADWYMEGSSPTISVDNISVTTLPAYGSSGVLDSSAFDGGAGVQWQTVSWDATAGGSTSVCVRTRTADTSDLLAAASWSTCYGSSGSGSLSANNRWIQYEVEMATSDTSTSPVFNEIRVSSLVFPKLDQTITFNSLSARTYGDADFVPGATASSGLGVAYASTDTAVATIVGGNIHILSAGTTTITASQAGDGTYNAASDAQQALTVNKKAASVTPNATGKTYGALDPALSGTLNGFLGGDNVTAIYSRTTGETAGTYTISAALSSAGVLGNYTITYNTANFTINPASLTVTADAKSKTYGTADPALTYTANGFVNNDTISIMTGTLTRVSGENVGLYAINQGTLSAGSNYTIAYTGANLIIKAVPKMSFVGVYQNGVWYIDKNGNGAWDDTPTDAQYFFGNGIANTIPVTGDWTGTGNTNIGIYTDGTWYLDLNGNGAWDGTPTDTQYSFGNGVVNAIPVTGDWTGDGKTKIGIYADGVWYLDLNGNGVWDGTSTDAQYSFGNGIANAIPVTGDWTGDGKTKIGIYVDGVWYLDLNGNGLWDGTPTDGMYFFGGGVLNAIPVTGDWTGDGKTKIGIFADGGRDHGVWYLDLNGDGIWDEISTDRMYNNFGGGVAGAWPVSGAW